MYRKSEIIPSMIPDSEWRIIFKCYDAGMNFQRLADAYGCIKGSFMSAYYDRRFGDNKIKEK